MAIAFTYDKPTNSARVTGGTSGTMATFADFVTADRAGSVTLLVATAGLSPTLSLTYQITPVELRALLISFIVASKTADADYIFITGTDFRDNAQTESIDVSVGNGTYVSTKYFRTITNIDCSDNAEGGGTVWADGTVAVTQPQWGVIWNYGLGQYQIDCHLNFGGGGTSTYFLSKNEKVTFGNVNFYLWSSANLYLGELVSSWGVNGSFWDVGGSGGTWAITDAGNSGKLYFYSSRLNVRNATLVFFRGGTITIVNSTFSRTSMPSYVHSYVFESTVTWHCNKVFFTHLYTLFMTKSPSTFTDVHVHNSNLPLESQTTNIVATGILITAFVTYDALTRYAGNNLTLVNPVSSLTNPENALSGGSYIRERFTVDIKVCDKDGVALSGVNIECEDQFGATGEGGFTGITTDVNGDITQQTITYRKWVDTDNTLTTYSPNKFTFSKAGYETLVLDMITVDHPIVWMKELQNPSGGGVVYKNIGIGVQT